jgi:GNAT superfamily N-acetyltransferase
VDIRTSISTGASAYEQRAEILGHLRAFNAAAAGPGNSDPLCITILADDDTVSGGLFGTTAYDWLVIELVFVPEALRGTGVGSDLIARAEEIARSRGCIGAWLDTFSFQARGFYEKLGYSLAGTIPDHPPGGARYFMAKRWDAG